MLALENNNVHAVVYSLTGLSSYQIGLTGELINELKSQNKSFKIVKCDNALVNCHFNQVHNIFGCAACQARKDFIHKKLGILPEQIIKLKSKKVEFEAPRFESYRDLVAFTYKGINIGRGVASSIISHYRDYNLNSDTYGDLIQAELEKSAFVLENILSIVSKYNPEVLYIFNGRFSEIHPVIQVCLDKKIAFYTIESGSKNKYELFPQSLPHSITTRTQKMSLMWDQAEPELRSSIGHDWFKKRRSGDEKYEISFVKKGSDNQVIKEVIDTNKKNILILNSSEDELKVIEEWEHTLYSSQNEAIRRILNHYKNNDKFNFILRVHPNLGQVDNIQIQEIKKFDFDNLKTINANVDLDTYALIDKADVVLVFGSSTGIEATYWGKPSILFGKSFYYHLDACYLPNNFEELCKLIETNDLHPKPLENTLIYGFYMATYGRELKIFEPDGTKHPKFFNQKIPIFNLKMLIYIFKYLRKFSLWQKMFKLTHNRSLSIKDIFIVKHQP